MKGRPEAASGSPLGGHSGEEQWRWPPLDLVRLALPRRVYTQSHVDYVVEGIGELFARRREIGGMRFVHRPEVLPHFTAVLAPAGAQATEVAGAASSSVLAVG